MRNSRASTLACRAPWPGGSAFCVCLAADTWRAAQPLCLFFPWRPSAALFSPPQPFIALPGHLACPFFSSLPPPHLCSDVDRNSAPLHSKPGQCLPPKICTRRPPAAGVLTFDLLLYHSTLFTTPCGTLKTCARKCAQTPARGPTTKSGRWTRRTLMSSARTRPFFAWSLCVVWETARDRARQKARWSLRPASLIPSCPNPAV